jgi:hypothetical protein
MLRKGGSSKGEVLVGVPHDQGKGSVPVEMASSCQVNCLRLLTEQVIPQLK